MLGIVRGPFCAQEQLEGLPRERFGDAGGCRADSSDMEAGSRLGTDVRGHAIGAPSDAQDEAAVRHVTVALMLTDAIWS